MSYDNQDPVFEPGFEVNPRRHDSISMVTDDFEHSSMSSIDDFIDNVQDERRFKKEISYHKSTRDKRAEAEQSAAKTAVERTESSTKQDRPIDFLMDHPYEMTFGRRIALSLANYTWYNPSLNKVANKTREEDFHDVFPQESQTKKARDKMEALTSISLQEAWAYFEHAILPRYVNDKLFHKDQGFWSRLADKYRQAQMLLEIAESGEASLNTRLYSPVFTPTKNMGDFGLGFGLYFSTLQGLSFLLFVAGCLNIHNIIFFAGEDYSDSQPGVKLLLKGSAICTKRELVPCIDCDSSNFSRDPSRLVTMINTSTNAPQTFVYHLACEVNFISGIISLATLCLIFIGMYVLSRYLKRREEKFDEENITAQDYTIQVLHPPTDENDPMIWKNFFERSFHNAHVACCTITVNNDDLIHALVRRRLLKVQIRKMTNVDYPKSYAELTALANNARAQRNVFQKLLSYVLKGVPEKIQDVIFLERQIQDLASKDYNVTSVFVTFETEDSQRKILSTLTNEKLSDEKFLFKDEFLEIKEPAEPSSIRWQDINEGWTVAVSRSIIPYIITFGMITGAAFVTREVRNYNLAFAAVFISLMNILFPMVAKFLTKREIHRNEGSRHASLYIKITLFRWVNTVIVTTILTPFTSTLEAGSNGLLEGIYSIFISEIVTINLLQLLDIGGNISRHFLAPRQNNQRDMTLCMRGTEVELAERYTNMTKVVLLTLWYSPIYPAVLFLGSIALYLNVHVDKFSLMRSWSPAPKLGASVSKLNRKFFLPITVLAMAVISSYTWSQFSFDNLCEVSTNVTDISGIWEVNDMSVIVDSSTSIYQYCDQDMTNRLPISFPALPRFQRKGLVWMNMEQEDVATIYGWTSVGISSILCLLLAKSAVFSFKRKYKPVGKASATPFTVSRCAAYIPEVKTSAFAYPLIAVNTDEIGKTDLFEWKSQYYGYDYYDLTLDAKEIMERDEHQRQVAPNAFSMVKHWDIPYE